MCHPLGDWIEFLTHSFDPKPPDLFGHAVSKLADVKLVSVYIFVSLPLKYNRMALFLLLDYAKHLIYFILKVFSYLLKSKIIGGGRTGKER